MSTWHDDDTLEEGLWFALHSAYPAAPYEPTTTATIAATIGNEAWASAVEVYFSNLSKLDEAVGV